MQSSPVVTNRGSPFAAEKATTQVIGQDGPFRGLPIGRPTSGSQMRMAPSSPTEANQASP